MSSVQRSTVDRCAPPREDGSTAPVVHFVPGRDDLVALDSCEDATLVFTHIPKTAGTTLDRIISAAADCLGKSALRVAGSSDSNPLPGARQALASDLFGQIPDDRLANLDYLSGHLPCGVHARIPRNCRYVTLLREPIARAISQHRMGPRRRCWGLDDSVGDLLKRKLIIDNPQVRQIAGECDLRAPCDELMLARAIDNLQTRYALVGTTEAFDETLQAMITWLGWPDVFYRRHQVSEDSLDAKLRERLAQQYAGINQYDARLYEFVTTHRPAHASKLLCPVNEFTPPPQRPLDTLLLAFADFQLDGKRVTCCPRAYYQPILDNLRGQGAEVRIVGPHRSEDVSHSTLSDRRTSSNDPTTT